MTGSFSFRGTSLSDYGLFLKRDWERSILPLAVANLLAISGKHGAYDSGSLYEPRRMILECYITAPTPADLRTRLDDIAALFDIGEGYQSLIFDDLSDRYWLAKIDGVLRSRGGVLSADLTIPLICADPFAYSTAEEESEHTINSNPDTFVEGVGGNALVYPVWEINPSVGINGTVKLKNISTAQEVEWTGILSATGDILEIDTTLQIVYKNSVVSMSSVSGQFPNLRGGQNNSVKVTGVSAGKLTITYRNRYL